MVFITQLGEAINPLLRGDGSATKESKILLKAEICPLECFRSGGRDIVKNGVNVPGNQKRYPWQQGCQLVNCTPESQVLSECVGRILIAFAQAVNFIVEVAVKSKKLVDGIGASIPIIFKPSSSERFCYQFISTLL